MKGYSTLDYLKSIAGRTGEDASTPEGNTGAGETTIERLKRIASREPVKTAVEPVTRPRASQNPAYLEMRNAPRPSQREAEPNPTHLRGAANPNYSANRAARTDDVRGEQLKATSATARHTASAAGVTVSKLSERLLADPGLMNNAQFTQTLTAAKVKADEANAAAEQASTAVSAWEKERWDQEMAAKYGGIRQSSDYTLKNRAVMDYAGDSLYDYVNDINNTRAETKQRSAINGAGGSAFGKYDGMTKEEIADFNYLFATQGRKAATEYLDEYLGAELNERQAVKTTAAVRDFTEKGKAAASAVSVPANLMSGIGIVELAYQQLKKGVTGSNRPIDWNTPAQQVARVGSEIRDKRSEDIATKHPLEIAGMNVASFLYGTGMSMADSAVTAGLTALGVPAAGALLGGAAATQAAYDAKSRGVTDGQALGYGLAAGAAEMIFETVSIGSLLSNKAPKSISQALVTAMKQGGVEASEEVMTSLANTLTDSIINGDKSEYLTNVQKGIDSGLSGEEAQKQAAIHWLTVLAGDALGGFLSGGIMGGGKGGVDVAIRGAQKAQQTATKPSAVTAPGGQKNAAEEAQRGEERKPAPIITAGAEKPVAGIPVTEKASTTKPTQREETPVSSSEVNQRETVYSGREAGVDAERIQQAARLSTLVNRKVVFYREAATGGGIKNGFYQDGVIHLNAASQNPVAQVISHELTHSVEATDAYKQLASLVEKRVTGMGLSMDTLRDRKTDLYARNGVTLSKEDADAEIIAEYVEKNLLTNEQSIAELVKQDRTLGQRLHDWIDSLLAKLGNGSAKERAFLTEAKRLYANALNQSTGTEKQTKGETYEEEKIISRDNPYLEQLREKLDSGDITEAEYDRLFDEYYDANPPEADGVKHSISPTMQRTGQDKEQVVADLRSYLRGGMSKAELLMSIDAVEADTKPAEDGAKAITEAAKANKQSVDQYLRENWMDYERDGRWKPEAQRALDAERRGAFTRKYSVSPSFSDACKQVEDGTLTKEENPFVYVSQTTPGVLQIYADAKDLPIIMSYESLYLATRKSGDLPGHYHDLGAERMNEIVAKLNDPDVIVRLKNGRINEFVSVEDRNGRRTLVSVELAAVKDFGGKNQAFNLILTAFGAKEAYLSNIAENTENEVLYPQKKTDGNSQVNPRLNKLPGTINEDPSAYGNRVAENGLPVKKQLSLSESDDKTYLAAVESGDMETANNIIREAAKSAGYDTVKLYHGTPRFGFTSFKGGAIFAVSDPSIAAGYTAGKGYGDPRLIAEKYVPDDGTVETLIANAKNVLHKNYREVSEEDIAKVKADFKKASDTLAKKVDDAWIPWDYMPDVSDEINSGFSWMLSLPGSISENLEDWFTGDMPLSELDSYIEHFEENKEAVRSYFVDHYKELKGTRYEPLLNLVMKFELSDYAIDARYQLMSALEPEKYLISEGGGFVDCERLRDHIEQVKDVGAYTLYGNLGDNPLEIDAGGAFWASLNVPELGGYLTTDNLVQKAKEKGYTAVVIKNVMDPSMTNHAVNRAADDYIFFSSSQVKSADLITYDDVGNIIPPSQRFDAEKNDIRYSITAEKEDTDPTATLPAKARDYLKRTERVMVNRLGNALSVPKHAQREYLQGIAREISREYLKTGTVSNATKGRLFTKAYDNGVITDTEFYNTYKHIKDHLRTTAVTLAEKDQGDIADYGAFVKSAFGRLRIKSEGGLPVDTAYAELHDMAPNLFPRDITHPADMLVQMLDVAESIRKSEQTLNEAHSDDAADFRLWARNNFNAALDNTLSDLNIVKRYAEEQAKAEEKPDVPESMDEVMKLFSDMRDARKAYERTHSKHLLTDYDEAQVSRLLKGEITLDNLDPKKSNVKGIKAVYEAKAKYETFAKQVRDFNVARKKELRAEAEKHLKNANNWKDKKLGLAYSRETMERNIRDITPDKETAEKVIDTYFKPVHAAQAEATKAKNAYRDRVKALNLSRKALKGDGKVSEAHAVQLIGEAEDNIRMLENSRGRVKKRDGKTLSEWQDVINNLWLNNPELDRVKINNAIQEFHKIYDELFKKMNEARVRNGYEPISYRNGYYPHFQPAQTDGILSQCGKVLGIDAEVSALPTEINGLTHTFKPGIRWFGHALERLGFDTAYDAVEGFDKYIEGAADVIFQTDNIQRLRALATEVRYRTGDDGIKKQIDGIYANDSLQDDEKQELISAIREKGRYALANFAVELDEYTNLLANKKSRDDRNMEQRLGRDAYNLVKALENRVAANMVAINPASWLTNFIPLTQGGSQLHRGVLLKGMWDTLRAYKSNDGFTEGSTFLTNRRGSDPLVRTWAQSASSVMSKPMEYIDQFTADSLVRARYAQNIRQGLSQEAAMEEADAWTAGVMADRSKGSMPTMFTATNPVTKLFTQFQLEVNNQFSYLFKDIPDKEKGLAALTAALLKFFIGAFLYNEVYEAVIGRRPALDPIGLLNDTVGDLTGYELPNLAEAGAGLLRGEKPSLKVEKKSLYDTAAALGKGVAEQIPFVGSLLGGGRIPISNALPSVENLAKAALNTEWSGKKRAETVAKEVIKPAAYILPPFGGSQMKRIYEGIRATVQGGSYGTDGNLQYPVYGDTAGEKILTGARAAVFGKTSLPEGREWIESGFKGYTKNQTAAYQGMTEAGVPGREAIQTIHEIDAIQKTDGETGAYLKRKALLSADISGEGKSALYYAMLASDKDLELMTALDNHGEAPGAVVEALMTAKNSTKNLKKYQAVVNSKMTGVGQKLMLKSFMGESEFKRMTAAGVYGVKPKLYVQALTKAAEISDNEGISQDEAKKVIRELGELTTQQKAAIFQCLCPTASKNPYSSKIGQEIYEEGRTEEQKKKDEEKENKKPALVITRKW